MKHGKKPTKKQSIFIRSKRLNPANWLVVMDTPGELVLVHRYSDSNIRRIRKPGKED